MPKLLSVFCSLLVSSSWAQAAVCTEFEKDFGELHSYRLFFNPDRCYLNISSRKTPADMIYRSYLVSNEGMLMVFNSYGPGEGPEFTGARVFYFFPRSTLPDIEELKGIPQVLTASPQAIFQFKAENAELVSMTGGQIHVDTKVNPQNNGGVEILQHQGLVLDVGYAQGHDPREIKDHESFFENSKNKKCRVKNADIFNYQNNNITLKFSDDKALTNFLKSRCKW